MKETLASLVSASALIVTLAVAAPVSAQTAVSSISTTSQSVTPIEISVNNVTRGNVGQEKLLKTVSVTNGTYTVKVVASNQHSVHPGNDIVVRSGQSAVVVTDVERKAFTSQTGEGTLQVTGGSVSAFVKLGKDKVFSGGMKVVLTPVIAEVPETPVTPATPETPEEPGKVLPATLPETGLVDTLGSLVAVGALSFASVRYILSRR